MRRTLVISFTVFLFFVYGLVLSQSRFTVLRDELGPENPPNLYDYRGATHVHSNRNLGSDSPADIITAAQDSGLDFLFFTDLNDFRPTFDLDGYHRKLLVMTGASYSYLDSRILSYRFKRTTFFESMGEILLALF